jgi:hypothetical protein
MKTKATPGARQSSEGYQNQVQRPLNIANRTAGLGATPSEPKIKLTPLRFDGVFWGWLARTDKNTFCWGASKAQAYHRLLAVLKHKQETQR